MRIWRISKNNDCKYARAGRRGSWIKNKEGKDVREKPLILEWLPDSDIIGDFTWVDPSELVVVEKIGIILKKIFSGFELGPVEMVQEEKFYNLKRKPTKPRVLLPYRGPKLYELWVTNWIDVDSSKSSFIRPEPGKSNIEGIEHFTTSWDANVKDIVVKHHPRVPGKGIFLGKTKVPQDCFFKVRELPAWQLCTDGVKNYIETERFTNISFLEVGETV